MSAVLIAVSWAALILDRWDRSSQAPRAKDPLTLELRSIAEPLFRRTSMMGPPGSKTVLAARVRVSR